MVKPASRRPVIWVILGLGVALFLMLPAMYPEARSLSYYYNRINQSVQGIDSNNKVLSWFSWSSSSGNGSQSPSSSATSSCFPPPLRVYMYDLPRKYNLGLFKRDDKDQELPWTSTVAPPWQQRWEVNKQHSVEYWLMVFLLDGWEQRDGRRDQKDGRRAAVRVRDPEQADVFFIPFFGSFCFNSFGHNMIGPGADFDRNLQVNTTLFLSLEFLFA